MTQDEITINGFTFLAPCPYTEGHPCTGVEAAILNRTLHARLRSNFAKIMDAYEPAGKSIDSCNREIVSLFADYCATYSLNGADPVEAEAEAIARSMVKSRIRKTGNTIGQYSKEQIAGLIEEILTSSQRQEIYEQAQSRLKLIREAAMKELVRLAS